MEGDGLFAGKSVAVLLQRERIIKKVPALSAESAGTFGFGRQGFCLILLVLSD